jgi:hypothetical protein
MKITIDELQDVLRTRFGGFLRRGNHKPGDGACCLLELQCAVRDCAPNGLSDEPEKVGLPDFRPMNDAYVDDAARTEAMLPLSVAFQDWGLWSEQKKKAITNRVAYKFITQILPGVLRGVSLEKAASECESAKDLAAARAAAWAAKWAAESAAARDAAWAAAMAAARAATRAAARTKILNRCCSIWLEAAAEVERGEG